MELDMTKGSPLKLILKFMIPVIIGNLFQQLYGMADTVIVGRFVGVDALAAVGSTGSITFMIFGFTQGLTTGFSVLTAQRFGAQDMQGVRKSISCGLILSVILAVIMTSVSLLGMDWLLQIMNTPDDIYSLTRSYIMVICGGMFGSILYNFLASVLRAIGNSVVPLGLLFISSVLNILLDCVFILVFHMGVEGAAYATIISQAVSAVLSFIYMIKWKRDLWPGRKNIMLDRLSAMNQLRIGIPMALQNSITAMGSIAVQTALNLLGSIVVASYSVSNKIDSLLIQPFIALGVTMATFSAQNKGRNDLERIKQGIKVANIISVIYALVIYVVAYVALPYIVPIFVSENISAVYGYVRTFLIICGAFFIPLGMIFIFRNTVQGCGYGFVAMFGGVLELVCRCVMAFIAARLLSYEGVCGANALAWCCGGIFFWLVYRVLMKRMEKERRTNSSGVS